MVPLLLNSGRLWSLAGHTQGTLLFREKAFDTKSEVVHEEHSRTTPSRVVMSVLQDRTIEVQWERCYESARLVLGKWKCACRSSDEKAITVFSIDRFACPSKTGIFKH